jgi:hypothetical protein
MQQLPLDGRDIFADGFEWTAEETALRDRLYKEGRPYQLWVRGELRTVFPRNPPAQLSA